MTTVGPPVITKDPLESFVITFDFAALLATGEKIASSVVTCELFFGVDPSPNNVLSGASQVEAVAGKSVLQRITGGVAGCIYRLKAKATTDASTPNIYTWAALIEING